MNDVTGKASQDIDATISALMLLGGKVSGWSYDDKLSVEANVTILVDGLIERAKADATRIQNLQLKLGQLVERGP